MTRHQRLARTLRSPVRAPKLRRNRASRQMYRVLYQAGAAMHRQPEETP